MQRHAMSETVFPFWELSPLSNNCSLENRMKVLHMALYIYIYTYHIYTCLAIYVSLLIWTAPFHPVLAPAAAAPGTPPRPPAPGTAPSASPAVCGRTRVARWRCGGCCGLGPEGAAAVPPRRSCWVVCRFVLGGGGSTFHKPPNKLGKVYNMQHSWQLQRGCSCTNPK